MTEIAPSGATIPAVTHHRLDVDGAALHYVSAGSSGSPVLLVHGWPETWWAFRKLIPLLSQSHRVLAVDLRGFGDSSNDDGDYSDAASAQDLHRLVEHFGAGPVHLLCQDVSGGLAFRLAATDPDDLLSFTAVESTLAGFGWEALADVNHGGSWHLGFFGAPGIPEMLLPGHDRQLLEWAYSSMVSVADAVTDADFEELVRTYARPDGWRGSAGLYQALFADNGNTKALAEKQPLDVPVLAVDGVNYPFTESTFRQVARQQIASVKIEGVGHLVAQEAPDQLAAALLDFIDGVDRAHQ